MAAVVTAAMPTPPPDPLHECLKVASMSETGVARFMESHQILTIEDIFLFRPIEYQDLINIYNGQQTFQNNKFGMYAHKKVTSCILWVCDIK